MTKAARYRGTRLLRSLGGLSVWAALLAAPATAGAADACTLFTPEEIAKIVGQRTRKPRPDTAEKGTACRFPTATESVSIALWPTNAKDFEAFRKMLADHDKNIASTAGIGDAAYLWDDDRIYVRVGDQGLTVTLAGGQDGIDPKRRETVIALAKAGVAKLQP